MLYWQLCYNTNVTYGQQWHDAMQSSPAAAARGGRLHWSFLLIPAGVAAFLGTWQVGRREWKVDQIRQREAALQVGLAPP